MTDIKILVADDAPTVVHLVASSLRSMGWDVTAVDNGWDAYQEGIDNEFDLALLDHFMPDMLGAEVLTRWRSEGVTTPVLFLSALEDDDAVVDVLERGAVDFLRKPFNPRELIARVKIQLAKGSSLV